MARQGPLSRTPSPYDRIKKAILDGTFQPAFVLAESWLSQWCGVSRTPVREALSRLEQDGLVSRTERGMSVTQRTPEEILDIYETRIALEGAAARMAALRHSPLDRIRIERLMVGVEAVNESDHQAMADMNREFHRGVWLATHNLALIDLLDRLNLHLLRYPITTLTAPGRWQQALTEHRALVSAVLDREPDRASAVAEGHFSTARDIRLALWEDITA